MPVSWDIIHEPDPVHNIQVTLKRISKHINYTLSACLQQETGKEWPQAVNTFMLSIYVGLANKDKIPLWTYLLHFLWRGEDFPHALFINVYFWVIIDRTPCPLNKTLFIWTMELTPQLCECCHILSYYCFSILWLCLQLAILCRTCWPLVFPLNRSLDVKSLT